MSRTRFWTILIGAEPTSFRAPDAGTLVPTLKQLQRKHPEAVLRWFERGQLFESEEAARETFEQAARERRPKDWRPGGEHRDPRARFKKTRDEKRRLFKQRQRRPPVDGTPPPAAGGDDRDTRRAAGRAPAAGKGSRFLRGPNDARAAREPWRRGAEGSTPNRGGTKGQAPGSASSHWQRPRSPTTSGRPGSNRGPKRGRD